MSATRRTQWLVPGSGTSPLVWLGASIVIGLAVFAIDYLTGSEISFSFFYLIPIAVASWFAGPWAGVGLAVASAAGYVADDLLNGRFHSRPSILYWNTGVELGIFVTLALILSWVRRGLEQERDLAAQLATAYRQLDGEFRIVGDIQRSLLPETPPSLPGYRCAVHYSTSTRAGGDYYDFFPMDDGRLGLLIADASGHGTPAAVLMAMTRILMHADPEAPRPPDRVLETLNRHLVSNIPAGQFVTACYATLDPHSGWLEYALAGHNPPFVVRHDSGALEELISPSGLPLGLFETGDYQTLSVSLEPGDTVLFYTDGLTEAQDSEGSLLGPERIQELLLQCRGEDPEVIKHGLLEEVSRHSRGLKPTDDLTLIVLQREAVELEPAALLAGSGTRAAAC